MRNPGKRRKGFSYSVLLDLEPVPLALGNSWIGPGPLTPSGVSHTLTLVKLAPDLAGVTAYCQFLGRHLEAPGIFFAFYHLWPLGWVSEGTGGLAGTSSRPLLWLVSTISKLAGKGSRGAPLPSMHL